jgi:SEC-C motif
MAEELEEFRRAVRWWRTWPARRLALEGMSLREDPTIRRLEPDEIESNPDLRSYLERQDLRPDDVLVYRAYADGPYGRYRVVAVFPFPPERWKPHVLCLDGPQGAAASDHRHGELELCLFYKDDPDERVWKASDGLTRLFDLARRHMFAECRWQTRPEEGWPIDEAPHGETEPAPRDLSLALPALSRPGRNEPCSCGSGRKAKKCCWR